MRIYSIAQATLYTVLCGDLNGKKIQIKEGFYVYVQLVHFAVHHKLTHIVKQIYYYKN